jgi:hypothetical protein
MELILNKKCRLLYIDFTYSSSMGHNIHCLPVIGKISNRIFFLNLSCELTMNIKTYTETCVRMINLLQKATYARIATESRKAATNSKEGSLHISKSSSKTLYSIFLCKM